MKRRSGEFWRRLVAEYEEGSEIQAVFAARCRVKVATFPSWPYRVRREREDDGRRGETAVRFVELRESAEDAQRHDAPMRIMTASLVFLLGLVAAAAPAGAACDDWEAAARISLLDPPGVTLDGRSGHFTGISFGLTVRSPVRHSTRAKLTRYKSTRIEVRDDAGNPVELGRPISWRSSGIPRTPELRLHPGHTSAISFSPYWLDLPGGGTYWMRIGILYPDLDIDGRGVWSVCIAWSEWTRVEYHPVVTAGGKAAYGPMARRHGVVVVDSFYKEVFWMRREPAGHVVKISLGRTTEDPRARAKLYEAAGLHKEFYASGLGAYLDLDARVDALGVMHVVFASGDKTAYLRVGDEGAILEKREISGKKGLAGPDDAIRLVDKPPRPLPPLRAR